MPQASSNQDFQPLPQYSQITTQNESWVNTTLTRTDPDGSRSQVFFLAKK